MAASLEPITDAPNLGGSAQRAAKNSLHYNVLAIALANSRPASLGRF